MRSILALTCAALASGQVLQVPDWFHYVNSTVHEREESCNGVKVSRWPAQGEPPHFRTLNPMGMSRITLPSSRQYPAKDGAYWLSTEATYVVVAGTAYMTFENGTEVELSTGDLFYSPAGLLHGPMKNKDQDDAVVMALADFTPQLGATPAIIPGATEPAGAVNSVQYAFHPRVYAPTGSPDLPDCITLSIYTAPNGQPGAISANLEANCILPFHYHATGVLYFYTQGVTTVGGDTKEPTAFHVGDGRWARPGWSYGPEAAGDTHTQFMVLGLPPDVGESPSTEELIIRDIEPEPVQIAYRNTQYSGLEAQEPAMNQVKKTRKRKHLRSSGDEAAFLQAPPGTDFGDEYDDEEEFEEEVHAEL